MGVVGRVNLYQNRLSNWIVDVILHVYRSQYLPAPSNVRCHSAWSVSKSWAAIKWVSLQDIFAPVTRECLCTLACYYLVNVACPHDVATAVLSTASIP